MHLPSLLVLKICGELLFCYSQIEEIVLRGLVKLLRKLEKLALPCATDRILSDLARYCPNLEELHFQVPLQ